MKVMNCLSMRPALLMGLSLMATALTPAVRAQEDLITENGVISGTMEIDFKTRYTLDTSGKFVEGSPAFDVKDKYSFTLSVVKTTEFAGTILRQPNLYTKNLRRLEQGAAIGYDVALSVLNPKDLKQKKTVGKWVGKVYVDPASGAYDLAAGKKEESPLRIAIDQAGNQQAFVDLFQGRLMGKAEKKDNLASYTYKRAIGQRVVEYKVSKVDPMRFEGVELAKGPSTNYPRAIVNGRLDYDYEIGNWMTDGIRFKYSLDGKDFEDTVTGSIKWVKDPGYETNGKSYYDFNLRFNEEKNRSSSTESAAFEKMKDEDAFFAVDNSVPSLTGRIDYVDTMSSGGSPTQSKITYSLNATKLTKQQIMNVFKLWMICVGPTNDE